MDMMKRRGLTHISIVNDDTKIKKRVLQKYFSVTTQTMYMYFDEIKMRALKNDWCTVQGRNKNQVSRVA